MWIWGTDYNDILSDNFPNVMLDPVLFDGNVWAKMSLSPGDQHFMAIKNDGTLWGIGNNGWGELGNGTQISRFEFTQIGNESNWQDVCTGFQGTYAVKSDGTLWHWGLELQDNTNFANPAMHYTLLPTRVGTDSDWSKISCSFGNVLAQKTDKSLWGWGNNYSGQLGIGTRSFTSEPIMISSVKNWIDFAPGLYASMALDEQGELWIWGQNDYYQLGNGIPNYVEIFQKVLFE